MFIVFPFVWLFLLPITERIIQQKTLVVQHKKTENQKKVQKPPWWPVRAAYPPFFLSPARAFMPTIRNNASIFPAKHPSPVNTWGFAPRANSLARFQQSRAICCAVSRSSSPSRGECWAASQVWNAVTAVSSSCNVGSCAMSGSLSVRVVGCSSPISPQDRRCWLFTPWGVQWGLFWVAGPQWPEIRVIRARWPQYGRDHPAPGSRHRRRSQVRLGSARRSTPESGRNSCPCGRAVGIAGTACCMCGWLSLVGSFPFGFA